MSNSPLTVLLMIRPLSWPKYWYMLRLATDPTSPPLPLGAGNEKVNVYRTSTPEAEVCDDDSVSHWLPLASMGASEMSSAIGAASFRTGLMSYEMANIEVRFTCRCTE